MHVLNPHCWWVCAHGNLFYIVRIYEVKEITMLRSTLTKKIKKKQPPKNLPHPPTKKKTGDLSRQSFLTTPTLHSIS